MGKYRLFSCIAAAFLIAMLIVPSGARATPGDIGGWSNTSSFSTSRYNNASTTYNGYVYVLGGITGSGGSLLDDVQFAKLNTDGTIPSSGSGSWTSTTSFTSARAGLTAVAYNGYLYVIGGGNLNYLNTVQYAPIHADGSIGAWSPTTSFTDGRTLHSSVISNGYLYILGGYTASGSTDNVQYALICDGTNSGTGGCGVTPGTVGTWVSTTSLSTNLYQHCTVVYNGHVYVIGGVTPSGITDSVQYATINPNGTLGSWVATTNLTVPRYGFSCVVANGYLYVIAGADGSGNRVDYTQYALINPDGTLGSWTTSGVLLDLNRYLQTSVVFNGFLYILGGSLNNGVGNNDVLYTALDVTPVIRDCGESDVVYCGAATKTELLDKIANGDGMNTAANIQHIYYDEGRGITPEGVDDSVEGYITHSGDVYVGGSSGSGGTLVATGALTSGRLQMDSTVHDGSLWRRDHAFARNVDYEEAFIGMSGGLSGTGTFQWAILKPCGNPVIATPTGGGGSPSPSGSNPPPSPSGSVPITPPPHNCCQITNRSVTLGSSVVSASTTADFTWHAGTATTTRAVKITVCTTAAYSDPCTKPTGASMSAATLASTGGQLGASGWSLAVVDDHTVLVTKSAGSSTTVGGTQTVGLAGFVNPSVYGTFHFRITTYNEVDADQDDIVDCGTVSTSTAKSITTVVDIPEILVFRVANAVAADCTSQTDITDPNDSTEDLVTLAPNPVSLMGASYSTAQMCIVSNAQHGYVITYHDEALGGPTKGFYNGAHEFGTAPSSGNGSGTFSNFTSTPGTEQFGFNLRLNTVPAFGHDPDAAGLVADLTNPQYSTVNQYSYDDTGTPITLAAKSAPSLSARYYMAYLANINALTPGGTYQAHQVFVATAEF